MLTVICFVIAGVTLYACVHKVCSTAVRVSIIQNPVADADTLEAAQQKLDELYKQEKQLTLDSVMEILNEEYGYEDGEEARTEA